MNLPLLCLCTLPVLGFLLTAGAALLDVRALRSQPPPELVGGYSAANYSRMRRLDAAPGRRC